MLCYRPAVNRTAITLQYIHHTSHPPWFDGPNNILFVLGLASVKEIWILYNPCSENYVSDLMKVVFISSSYSS